MIEYTVDEKRGIICSRFTQAVDLSEAVHYLQRTASDPKCDPSYGRLVIIESGAVAVNASQGNLMREVWEKTGEKHTHYSCAIVCDGTSEALIRVLMYKSSMIDSSVRFFSSRSAAVAWLETKRSKKMYEGDLL